MKTLLQSSQYMPNRRSIASSAALVKLATEMGMSTKRIVNGTPLTGRDLKNPELLISPQVELRIIRNVVQDSPDPRIGLIAGQRSHVGIYGKLGMLWIHCDSLWEAFQKAIRFKELFGSFFQHIWKLHGDYVHQTFHENSELKEGRIFLAEREAASFIRMTTDVAGLSLSLKEARFAYPKTEYAETYQDVFACPVTFEAENHQLIYHRRFLEYPFPRANLLMKKTFETECEKLIGRFKNKNSMADHVRQEIAFSDEIIIPIETIAQRFGISSRTLRRRLVEEGESYQQIVEAIRKKRAIELLVASDIRIEEVATKVGYSDTANFYHAFKRWTGSSPGKYRRENKQTPLNLQLDSRSI